MIAWLAQDPNLPPAIRCTQLWERINGWEVVLVAVVIAICLAAARIAQMYFTWRIASNNSHCPKCGASNDERGGET